jgi:hypothetical protein
VLKNPMHSQTLLKAKLGKQNRKLLEIRALKKKKKVPFVFLNKGTPMFLFWKLFLDHLFGILEIDFL